MRPGLKALRKYKSILEAGKTRLRPIFLTTVTTVAGILPTAYGLGGLDPFVVPIALALGWGMFFGSFLTTILFPSWLAILDDILYLFAFIYESLFHPRPITPSPKTAEAFKSNVATQSLTNDKNY